MPGLTGLFGFDFEVADGAGHAVASSASIAVGDGPMPPYGWIDTELVQLSLSIVSPTVIVRRDSLDPRLREAIGVCRIRGGDPTLPYAFACLSTGGLPLDPGSEFLFSAGGVLRYRPPASARAGTYTLNIRCDNGGFASFFGVFIEVQVP